MSTSSITFVSFKDVKIFEILISSQILFRTIIKLPPCILYRHTHRFSADTLLYLNSATL